MSKLEPPVTKLSKTKDSGGYYHVSYSDGSNKIFDGSGKSISYGQWRKQMQDQQSKERMKNAVKSSYTDLLGIGKPVVNTPPPTPQPKVKPPSFWQQTIDNTFGSSKGHGDIYKMTVGLKEVPGAVAGFIGNVAKGGYHGVAGAVDELTGNYAGSAAHAKAADRSWDTTKNTVGTMFGANEGGLLYNLTDAAGRWAGGDVQGAKNEFVATGRDVASHPVMVAATLLPAARAGMLSRAAQLESVAAKAATTVERISIMNEAARLRSIANGGAAGRMVNRTIGQVGSRVMANPVTRKAVQKINYGVEQAQGAASAINHFQNPLPRRPQIPANPIPVVRNIPYSPPVIPTRISRAKDISKGLAGKLTGRKRLSPYDILSKPDKSPYIIAGDEIFDNIVGLPQARYRSGATIDAERYPEIYKRLNNMASQVMNTPHAEKLSRTYDRFKRHQEIHPNATVLLRDGLPLKETIKTSRHEDVHYGQAGLTKGDFDAVLDLNSELAKQLTSNPLYIKASKNLSDGIPQYAGIEHFELPPIIASGDFGLTKLLYSEAQSVLEAYYHAIGKQYGYDKADMLFRRSRSIAKDIVKKHRNL